MEGFITFINNEHVFGSLYSQASGNLPVLKCKKILLAEDIDGLDIHPYNTWTFRKNPGDLAQVKLLATKFGKPLPGARVRLDPCNCENIFSGGPEVGQPALDVPSYLTTDKNGRATLDIEAKDPKITGASLMDNCILLYTPLMVKIKIARTCAKVML